MKKFLIVITVLAMTLAGTALGEYVPVPQFDYDTETEQPAEEQAAAETENMPESNAGYTVPSGERIFQYEMKENGDIGIEVLESEYTDSVQAKEPAEHSMKYTALPGTKLLHIRYVFRFRASSIPVDTIQGVVVDGKMQSYYTSAFIEGKENTISHPSVRHDTVECKSHPNQFIMPISGSTKNISGYSNADCFALCDFVAEIPESLVGTGMPFYLVIRMGESDYYYPIP